MEWTLYVDLDAYYVACELRDHPELEGRPVLVGPDPSKGATRGVVLSASYPARALGVRGAMPVQRAALLAPEAVWFPPDFPKYERISREVRERLARFAPRVVPLSIDEAAVIVDVEGPDAARAIAEAVQQDLRATLHLSASVGVATHRTVAKIASDRGKPGGIVVVPPDGIGAFLAPLPVRSIPGVGPKAEEALHRLGIETIDQLAHTPKERLRRSFGRFGDELVELARGRPGPLPPDAETPRSRSAERTFVEDVAARPTLREAVERLASAVAQTLAEEGLAGATVSVAFRWGDFERSQRSRTLAHSIASAAELAAEAQRLAETLWAEEQRGRGRPVRTVSVRVGELHRTTGRQRTLGEEGPEDAARVN